MRRIEHGTRRGFQQHKAIGSIPCEPCEDANRDYMREYQRTHYSRTKRREAYLRAKARGYYARCVLVLAIVLCAAAVTTAPIPEPDCRPFPVELVSQQVTADLLQQGWRGDPADGMEALYPPGC